MAGKVQIKIDVDSESVEFATDKTLTLTEKTRLLKKELQTVPEGTKEWHILNNTFNDTKDALDRVNTKSKDIFGTFSLLPGPIGQISNTLESTIDAFKIFGSLKTTDIKAQLGNLLQDFKGMATTIGNLTGITKLYTVTNEFLSKALVKVGVGEGIAATGAKALSAALIATGLGAFVVLLGMAAAGFYEMATGTDAAAAAEKRLNDQLEKTSQLLNLDLADAKRRQDKNIADMKAGGKSEADIRTQQVKDTKENLKLTETALQESYANQNQIMKEGKGDLAKAQDETLKFEQKVKDLKAQIYIQDKDNLTAANKEKQAAIDKANAKGEAQAAKNKADRDKELDAIKKGNEDALQETMSEKDKEERLVNEKYKVLIDLANKYGMDTTQLKKGQAAALAKITDKYNKEDQEKEEKLQEERLKKLEEYLNKEQNLRDSKRNYQSQKAQQGLAKQLFDGLITEQEYQDKSLASNLAFAQKKQTDDETTYNANKLALDTLFANKGISEKLYQEKSAEDKATYDQQVLDNDVAVTDAGLAIDQNAFDRRKALAQASVEVEQAAAQSKTAIQFAYADAVGMVGNLLTQFAGKNKGLAKAGVILEQGANVAKILIGASSSIAQQTAAANAQAAIFPPLAPVIFANLARGIITTKIGAGIGVIGAIAGAAKGIADINSADTGEKASGGGGGGAAAASTGSKFANGGLLSGRSHAEGGITTPYGELEGGEFVINKRSTQSFLPLLSAINSMGNRRYENGGMTASMDQLQTMMANQATPIVKTYVVASDMSSQMEADFRIKQLARL
jgi:hypothetical protein